MSGTLHLHLDPIGGIAGDMFVAALLDAWPEHADAAVRAVRAAGLGEEIAVEHLAHHDGVLRGSRFRVAAQDGAEHAHVHWRDLRERLSRAPLAASVRARAIAIFERLAEAEAWVHGVPTEEATFHEVGAWDSIADIVAAAYLIDAVGAVRWSVAPLPLGGGRVKTAHGELPVPAPATARLLEGFAFHDDGRMGERVTPTGAAILKYLITEDDAEPGVARLSRTGHGFGARRLDGMSNILRVLAFETDAAVSAETVAVISFEIDDQTPEDLVIGLDRLRAEDGVLDLLQVPVFAKKGRLAAAVRLLVRPDAVERTIEACFEETTTLGLRWRLEHRAVLARRSLSADDGVAVKLAERPGGRTTAKAESDDLKAIAGQDRRERARRNAEADALRRPPADEEEG